MQAERSHDNNRRYAMEMGRDLLYYYIFMTRSAMTLTWKAGNPDSDELRDEILHGERLLPRDPDSLPSDAVVRHESMLINEVSLVLAEKRTSLSVMRTGLAILALPLSVLSVLVVISRYYDPMRVMYFLAPLLFLCVVLTILGAYMIIRSFKKISHFDRVIVSLKKQNANLRDLCLIMDGLVAPDKDY